MKDVILVHDVYDGILGVADSYKTAVDCAIDWIDGVDKLEVWADEQKTQSRFLTLQEQKDIYRWGIDKFNENCVELYLRVDKLWES